MTLITQLVEAWPLKKESLVRSRGEVDFSFYFITQVGVHLSHVDSQGVIRLNSAFWISDGSGICVKLAASMTVSHGR